MVTNGPVRLILWMARATTSLPVPVSPSSSAGQRQFPELFDQAQYVTGPRRLSHQYVSGFIQIRKHGRFGVFNM